MPENITINKELGIIEVHSYGDVTREVLDLSLVTLKQIAEDTGIRMVLVDTTEQETMPTITDIFYFVVKLPETFRFAIIVSEKQSSKDDQDFLETVAYNRFFNVKEFFSRKEAVEWLKG